MRSRSQPWFSLNVPNLPLGARAENELRALSAHPELPARLRVSESECPVLCSLGVFTPEPTHQERMMLRMAELLREERHRRAVQEITDYIESRTGLTVASAWDVSTDVVPRRLVEARTE